MMSLSKLRQNLFRTFELMRDTNLTIEFYHRRKVYKMHIEQTGERVTTPYKITRKKAQGLPQAMLRSVACTECDSLKVNNICMNKACPSNQKAPVAGD